MYLAFPLESFWVEMTIGLVGGGGLGGALQLLEDIDRPPAKTKQEREGLRNGGSEAVHSHITVTAEGL